MPFQNYPSSQSPTPNPAHPVKGVSGKRVLLGSLIGCIVLFFIVWGTLRLVEHHVHQRPDLVWADRADWPAPAVIRTTLVKPNAANAQYTYNKPRYRDPGLAIPDAEQASVLRLTEIARSDYLDKDPAKVMSELVSHNKNNFYAQYILGTNARLQGEPELAEKAYQAAIDLAPKILVIQYTDPAGRPVAGLKLDRVEIGCDRVTGEGTRLDQRLVLVYPQLQTDAAGRVYLPVYDTTYRPVYLPQPDGYKITYTPDEGWFKTATHLGLIKARVNRLDG